MDNENVVLYKETFFDKIFKPEIITLENGHTVRRRRSRTPFIIIGLVLVILWALRMTEFDIMVIIDRFAKMLDLLKKIFQPDWTFFPKVIDPLMDTIKMSILGTVIGCAIALVACFSVPASWGETAQYIFFFITYTLLNAVFFTANNIAYASLTALITKNTNERVQLGSIRFIFAFGTSMLIQYITIDAVGWLGGGTTGWRAVAIIYAIVGLVVNTISVFSVKELPEAEEGMEKERAHEHKLTFRKSLGLLLKNKYYVII